MHPFHPDSRRWQARQHQDKPLHFVFSNALPSTKSLLLLQVPLTKDQFWWTEEFLLHITAIQLHWFCFCFALLLNCLIKVQMPLLIQDRQEKKSPYPNTRTIMKTKRETRFATGAWIMSEYKESKHTGRKEHWSMSRNSMINFLSSSAWPNQL